MLRHIPTDKEVLRKWLKAGFMENRILFPTEAGTPQGGIISPTLANLTLDGLETLLKERFPVKRVRAELNPKVNLIRYADDFIITGATKDVLENEVKPLVEQFLRDRGLQLSPEKTCITHIEQGFDFLGQNLRKFDGKLLIRPSKKNTHAFLEKVRQLIRQNGGQPDRLDTSTQSGHSGLGKLPPPHRGDGDVQEGGMGFVAQLSGVGPNVRHPGKVAHWISRRYWHPIGRQSGGSRRTQANGRRTGNRSG